MSKDSVALKLALVLLTITITSWAQKPEEKNLKVPQHPEDNRFTEKVLTSGLDEPMEFEVLNSGKVYFIERRGKLQVYDPVTQITKLVANIDVNTKKTDAQGVKRDSEEGLMGFALDPNFETNHWIYLYYAHPTESKDILTRWELRNDELITSSQKVLLEVPVEREQCCVTGGGITFDAKGNLYLTVGNNTANGTAAHTDERPGRSSWDDQRASSNTNDLRGKVLRIHPEQDGTYTIPEGNLFPKGMAKTRPEIYTMGHRNPWRPFIDSKTGWLYYGEIGVDFTTESEMGPKGYDAFLQARKATNFGWPYFIADKQPFPMYDYATNKVGEKKDPNKPTNNSVNNTGLTELPPVEGAFIYYPYAVSEKFPLLGSGARSAIGGPIYHRADFRNPKNPFPDYYEGKWFITEFIRNWIMVVTFDENGNYKSMERFLPDLKVVSPMDMKFGPDGGLYVIEYGSGWFKGNADAKLVKIEYNTGNRTPVVQASASKLSGIVPLKTTLSSAGTKDYDNDALKYEWKVTSATGTSKVYAQANPSITLDKAGVYSAMLTVTDAKGAKNSQSVTLTAGNEAPMVSFDITQGNKTFFFPNKPIGYTVHVSDKEDGSLENGKITADQVAVSIDYLSEGFDFAQIIHGQRSVDASTQFNAAMALMNKSDCKTCHNVDTKSAGPSFTQIAAKYQGDASAVETLSKKVIGGGKGVWGEVNMSAHPALTMNDASTIVKYILNINDKTVKTLPSTGEYTPVVAQGDNGRGAFVLRAAYKDKGAASVPSLSSEDVIVLRSNTLRIQFADTEKDIEQLTTRVTGLADVKITASGAYAGFTKIDLTNIGQVEFGGAQANAKNAGVGGTVEIHMDSPSGELLGQIEVSRPQAQAAPGGGGQRGGIKTDIKKVSGVHDVYLVFKNDKAPAGEPLMTLTSVTFNAAAN